MTKAEIEQNGLNYLASDEFKKARKKNAEQIKIQKKFLERFTQEFVATMSIDDYVEGKEAGHKNSFCYILEFQMDAMGMIRGSTAAPKFGIYYSEKDGEYKFLNHSKFGNTPDEIFRNIRQALVDFLDASSNGDLSAMEKNLLSPMFKGKIYYIYNSNKALPVYSEKHVDFFIRALEIPCDIDNTGAFEKRALIVDWKNASSAFKDITTLEFMDFLYSSYGFKYEIDLLKDGVNPQVKVQSITVISGKDAIDRQVKESTMSQRKPNYEEINRKKSAIGSAGENFVLEYEKERVKNRKLKKLIERVSMKDDSLGYDIKSFDEAGNEIHIEVKTSTSGSPDKIDFFISSNEFEKLQVDSAYMIYYVCGINKAKKTIIILKKDNLTDVHFKPIAYQITSEIR